MALLLSIAALFLNPVGLKLVLYPLQIMLGSPINLGAVDEWKPLQLDSQRGIGFMAVIGGIVLATIVQRSLLYFHEILLLILTIVQAGSHERLVFVFGIVAAPILCRILSTSWAGYSLKQDHPWANALLLGISLLIAVLAFPNRQDLVAQVDQHSPVGAVEYINSQHLPGPMLNDYVFGGYLIWASPDHPVFVDGRTDIFEWTGVLDEYGRWATLRSNPSDLLERHKIGFCLLSRQSPMIFVLKLLPNWKIVYSDSTAIVLIRTHPSA
jgi:hypothetical protein